MTVASTGTYVNDSVYDENKQLIAFAYVNNSSNVVAGNVVGISGTTVTVGTAVTFASENSDWITISYDSVLQKSLVTYSTSASALKAIIVAITDASTISADGTASDSGLTATNITSAFDVRAEKHGVFFRNQTTTRFCVIPVTTTAGGITWGSVTDLDTAGQWNHNIAVYDPDQQVLVNAGYEAYSPYASNAIAGYFAYESTNLTSTNLLGLAPSAISDTATGTINTWGSRCESSGFLGSGVSKGTAVQYSASNLADIYAADSVYDSTNNKIIVVYDGASSGAGYGIVGTISGTSVSYGSAVQYSSGNAYFSQVTYDSTNQRVVVAYADTANSNYLTAVVGTVSGTSISWGTPVVADSTASDFYTGIDFDINAGKVLIIWKDNVTAYNYSIVGTVSGTSISFGTRVLVDGSWGYQMIGGLIYDENAQKHLFTRPRTSGSASDAYVGTISGTSVSWGSATSISSTEYLYNIQGSYDSNAQKIAIIYQDASASAFSSQVATISGTSVSFGTRAVIDSTISPDFTGSYYDSSDQTIVAFGRATNYYGYIGTISGTSISWSAGQTLILDADFGYGLGSPSYDANADAGLILFANAGGTAAESAVTTSGPLPLTVTSDYYVQTDGTLSTTSTSPAQLIGKAIKTNQINIKDYTG